MSNHTEDLKFLNEAIKDINVAMLVTTEQDGTLRSRPMATQEAEFDGDLWFFTQVDAPKVNEVEHDRQVNVSYADPKKQNYVSVSGKAQVVRDRAKMEELWQAPLKLWFPDGLDDPQIALLKVHAEQAEIWSSSSNAIKRTIDFAAALATGDDSKLGENRKIDL